MYKRFSSALILAIGIALSGYFVAYSIRHFHNFNRYVAVKGLAEKTVKANEAIMSIRFSANGNTLQAVYHRIEHSQQAIVKFLTQHGMTRQAITFGNVSIMTLPQTTKQKTPKFTANSSIHITTTKVTSIEALSQKTNHLINQGVILNATNTSYRFTHLNHIKLSMLTTATDNAQQAASTFAHNANAQVGSIRQASQGLFTISNADGSYGDNDVMKTIRVVVQVQYFIQS